MMKFVATDIKRMGEAGDGHAKTGYFTLFCVAESNT